LGFLAAATSVVSQEIEAACGRFEMATDVAVKERPILFSGAMVRAILEGRKTQTRRVMKPQLGPCNHCLNDEWAKEHGEPYPVPTTWFADDEDNWCCATCGNGMHMTREDVAGIRCPYGKHGDRLWVRETWATIREYDAFSPCKLAGDDFVYYAASDSWNDHDPMNVLGKLRPSIFMPRWASRLTLEVTGVRVERLCDISGMDAVAEGYAAGGNSSDGESRAREAFLNGDWARSKREANPWVWVIEFKTVSPAATEGQ
jgi:hypothetical protein